MLHSKDIIPDPQEHTETGQKGWAVSSSLDAGDQPESTMLSIVHLRLHNTGAVHSSAPRVLWVAREQGWGRGRGCVFGLGTGSASSPEKRLGKCQHTQGSRDTRWCGECLDYMCCWPGHWEASDEERPDFFCTQRSAHAAAIFSAPIRDSRPVFLIAINKCNGV